MWLGNTRWIQKNRFLSHEMSQHHIMPFLSILGKKILCYSWECPLLETVLTFSLHSFTLVSLQYLVVLWPILVNQKSFCPLVSEHHLYLKENLIKFLRTSTLRKSKKIKPPQTFYKWQMKLLFKGFWIKMEGGGLKCDFIETSTQVLKAGAIF